MIVQGLIPLLCWAIGPWSIASAWSFPTFCSSFPQQHCHWARSALSSGSRRSLHVAGGVRGWGHAPRTRVAAASAGDVERENEAYPAQVSEGDLVVIVGASGQIGSLVARSLAATGRYKLRGLVRSIEKAEQSLGQIQGLELAECNILERETLGAAMKNAACVVACTGTTAFPSARWGGGNTPNAVDNIAVGNMVRAAADTANHPDGGKLKRFVLLSSVGVERKDSFPFVILNLFGVLDAKAKGEATLRAAAKEDGFSYCIVRPGQIAEEYSTVLPDSVPPSKQMVSLRQGDEEAGSVHCNSVAATFTQAVQQPGAADKSFTVINTKGPEPTQEVWDALFAKL